MADPTHLNAGSFCREAERCVFQWKDRWRVLEAATRLPDGKLVDWAYIQETDYVVAVPVGPAGEVYLKREYRASRDALVLELPGGKVEAGKGSPAEQVNRELQEEIGLRAGQVEHLVTFFPWNHATFAIHAFLATGLVPVPLPPDEDEWIEVVPLPLETALCEVMKQGANAQSLLGLLFAREALGRMSASGAKDARA